MPDYRILIRVPHDGMQMIKRIMNWCTVISFETVDGLPADLPEMKLEQPRGVRGWGAKRERNAAIIAEYEAGKADGSVSAETLGQKYGITRERICQILRPSLVISKAAARLTAGREAVAEEAQSIKERSIATIRNKIAVGIWLMEGGMSLRQASAALSQGLHSRFTNSLGAEARRRGLKLSHGRHRDFSERKKRALELSAQGLTIPEIVKKIREEGADPHAHEVWFYTHMPELKVEPNRPAFNRLPNRGEQVS